MDRKDASNLKLVTSDRFTVLSKADEKMCSTAENESRAAQERDMTDSKTVYSECGAKEVKQHRQSAGGLIRIC